MKADTIWCYCISKWMAKKHCRITTCINNRARLTACEVGVFLREISQVLKDAHPPLWRATHVHHSWAYFLEIMICNFTCQCAWGAVKHEVYIGEGTDIFKKWVLCWVFAHINILSSIQWWSTQWVWSLMPPSSPLLLGGLRHLFVVLCNRSKYWPILYSPITPISTPGHVAGQFTAAPPTCPGGMMVFTCTVTGDMSGVTTWRVGGSSECLLSHNTAGTTSNCGPGNTFIATPGNGFGTSATSFSSTLSGTATSELNGTLVECFGPNLVRQPGNTVGNSSLQILGKFTSGISNVKRDL